MKTKTFFLEKLLTSPFPHNLIAFRAIRAMLEDDCTQSNIVKYYEGIFIISPNYRNKKKYSMNASGIVYILRYLKIPYDWSNIAPRKGKCGLRIYVKKSDLYV